MTGKNTVHVVYVDDLNSFACVESFADREAALRWINDHSADNGEFDVMSVIEGAELAMRADPATGRWVYG